MIMFLEQIHCIELPTQCFSLKTCLNSHTLTSTHVYLHQDSQESHNVSNEWSTSLNVSAEKRAAICADISCAQKPEIPGAFSQVEQVLCIESIYPCCDCYTISLYLWCKAPNYKEKNLVKHSQFTLKYSPNVSGRGGVGVFNYFWGALDFEFGLLMLPSPTLPRIGTSHGELKRDNVAL